MQPTRRFWATLSLAALLAVGGAVIGNGLPIVGAATIGGWLLARQYLFVRDVAAALDDIHVARDLSRTSVVTGDAVTVSLEASRSQASPLRLTVESSPPVAATGSTAADRRMHLAPDETDARTTFDVTLPTAGTFEFDRPTVTATDGLGLFRTDGAVPADGAQSIGVEPRAPRDVHVGQGGDRYATGVGEQTTDQRGSGLEPATVRQYLPGDDVRRIDWKATARLNHPHVREYEIETDPTTALFVDTRPSMGTGPDGETKLDYAREVALAFVNSARSLNARIGLYAVGDDGVASRYPPHTSSDHYVRLRRTLQDLRPPGANGPSRRPSRRPTLASNRVGRVLANDTSRFGATLRPYFASRPRHGNRSDDQPLATAVRRQSTHLTGAIWSVIVTDDANRSEVREAVKLGRQGEGQVLVFLTPTVLFEPGGLADLEDAYASYAEFERFRRSLSNLEGVSAFEVGPGGRLAAVLSARGGSRMQTAGRGST